MTRLSAGGCGFKQALIRQARLEKARRVLDLGCGTATLTLRIQLLYSYTEVVGIDGDPNTTTRL